MIEDEAGALGWLALQPECDAAAKDRLERFVEMLGEENEKQNLVSRTSLAEAWRRHIVDSAQLLLHVPRETKSWLDLGAGAGFPGIVVAILRPDCAVALVESRKRRIEWLIRLRDELGLANVEVQGSRLEDVPYRRVDVISARAFAPLDRLLTLSARFSTSDTVWLLPKGKSAREELAMLRGWNHMFHVEQSLTDDDAGVIVGTLQGKAAPGRKVRSK